MPQVKPVKVNGQPVPGLYQKVNTEGDAARFIGADSGYVQAVHKSDNTVLSDGRSRVAVGPLWPAPNNTPTYIEFVLGFRYFVGRNQLQVALIDSVTGRMTQVMSLSAINASRALWADWVNPPADVDLDPASEFLAHFQEISTDVVRIVNPGSSKVFVFYVPHTSLQATSRGRVVVDNQGDNVAVEMLGEGDGLLLKSRGGRRGLLRIDENLVIGVDPR